MLFLNEDWVTKAWKYGGCVGDGERTVAADAERHRGARRSGDVREVNLALHPGVGVAGYGH